MKGWHFLVERRAAIASVALTVILESLTLILRFGAKLESTRDTASTIGLLTMGIRIHHGYLGAATILVAYGLQDHLSPRWVRWLAVIGVGLFASDMIHHFLVLWPITGSPQFDWRYPVG